MSSLGKRLAKRLSKFSSSSSTKNSRPNRAEYSSPDVSYSSLETSLSEVPADNNERFDKDLWTTAQMSSPKDPRLDLPRGGLPKPEAEWYDALDEEPASWTADVFYRGLDITIREYLQAEADLVEMLHDTDADGVPWAAREWSLTVSIKTRYIFERLQASYDFLATSDEAALARRGVPAWFIEDGLNGWMESRAKEMGENPEFCKYQRSVPRSWATRTPQDKRIDSFHAEPEERQYAHKGLHEHYHDNISDDGMLSPTRAC